MVASTGTDSVRAGLPLYHPSAFVDRDYSFGRCCRDTALTSDAAVAVRRAPLRSLRRHNCTNQQSAVVVVVAAASSSGTGHMTCLRFPSDTPGPTPSLRHSFFFYNANMDR